VTDEGSVIRPEVRIDLSLKNDCFSI